MSLTSEDRLLGWLCIARLHWESGMMFNMPDGVRDRLADRGWLAVRPPPPGSPAPPGASCVTLEDSGKTATDLAAPEWGIDPVGLAGG